MQNKNLSSNSKFELLQHLSYFYKSPSSNGLLQIINDLKPYITKFALNWKNSKLNLYDKISEVITEIYFVLVEDIDINKINNPESFINYLSLRLKRLTSSSTVISKTLSFPNENLKYNIATFTPFVVDLTKEIAKTTRLELYLLEKNFDTKILEFLFIHIYPEVKWVTKILYTTNQENNSKNFSNMYELYKKRHQSFHKKLRSKLQNIAFYDISEIHNWKPSEKRYLAWNIIDFSFQEIKIIGTDIYSELCKFREQPQLVEKSPTSCIDIAYSIVSKLSSNAIKLYDKDPKTIYYVSDNDSFYSDFTFQATESFNDIFYFLFTSHYKATATSSESCIYDNQDNYSSTKLAENQNEKEYIDEIFEKCLNDFMNSSKYFTEYIIKNKISKENKTKY